RVAVYRRRTAGGANLHGTTVLTAQVWYHGAMTYDGSTVRVYLNGNEENSVAEADLVGPDPAGIQHGGGCSTRYFDGIIDEVRVASVTRSDDWITAQYKSMTDTFIRWKPGITGWTEVDPYGP
ncbi:MAG: LamG-like jellyroll fold domain-containing protein, partial [Gemmatimonadales bacterium]